MTRILMLIGVLIMAAGCGKAANPVEISEFPFEKEILSIEKKLSCSDFGISCIPGKTIIIYVDFNDMAKDPDRGLKAFDSIASVIFADWKGSGHALRTIGANTQKRISFKHNEYLIEIKPGEMGARTVGYHIDKVK